MTDGVTTALVAMGVWLAVSLVCVARVIVQRGRLLVRPEVQEAFKRVRECGYCAVPDFFWGDGGYVCSSHRDRGPRIPRVFGPWTMLRAAILGPLNVFPFAAELLTRAVQRRELARIQREHDLAAVDELLGMKDGAA